MADVDEDDWEVAVDTGQFEKQLKQHERDRAASEKMPVIVTSVNTDYVNPVKSNQPIRILKRPTTTSQSEVPSLTPMISPFADQISSSNPVPSPTLIPRESHRSNKTQIKTYEQREMEYRLARLRIMGEEESEDTPPSPIVQTIEETKTNSTATTTTATRSTST